MESKVKSFGEKLKKERERKKITLDEVATATKISTRMLRALEEENFHQLPGGIFNKGFVRAYARHLGMNEERALADYVKALGDPGPAQPEDSELRAIAERREKERETKAKGMPWGVIAVLLLVACLGLAIWGFYSREKARNGRSQPAAETQAKERAPGVSASGSASRTPPADNAKPGLVTEASDSTETTTLITPVSDAQPLSSSVQDNTLKTAQASFAVLIEAREDSWLSVTSDGKLVYQDVLAFPAEMTFRAEKQMLVRAGNIGGLNLSFNGSKLGSLGGKDEVKTLSFDANGLESAATKPAN